ncbi:MAG: hypothetical protein SFX18_17570 [Pirellulales bacterium]|nr:hypothetical protein [Pirellulales bacterium]
MYPTQRDLEQVRQSIKSFIHSYDIQKSTLILDGPGYGCSQQVLWLALIGKERLECFQRIHVFSAAGYAYLLYLAKQTGCLVYNSDSMKRWNLDNMKSHGIRAFGLTLMRFLLYKTFIGGPYFGNVLLADPINRSFTKEFAEARVTSLPANISFWAYDANSRAFIEIDSKNRFSEFTLSELMRAIASMPYVYESFCFNGHVLRDAAVQNGVGELFRQLRSSSDGCMFLSMERSGQDGSTSFYKLHKQRSGKLRLNRDMTLFLAGIDNLEFVECLRLGLFELEALST